RSSTAPSPPAPGTSSGPTRPCRRRPHRHPRARSPGHPRSRTWSPHGASSSAPRGGSGPLPAPPQAAGPEAAGGREHRRTRRAPPFRRPLLGDRGQPWRTRRWRGPRSSGRCWTSWPRTTPGATGGSCSSSGQRPSCSALPRSLTCACGRAPRWVRRVGAAASGAGAAERCAQPRVGLLQGGARRPLFINVCSWKRVPAPKGPTDPTPVSAGPLEHVCGEGDLYSIIDVAYNPEVLQRGQENPEKMEHLIHLTLKFVEERCNLTLSHLYTIESFKCKGSLETMQQRLRGRQRPAPHLSQNTKKELTLEELLRTMEAEDCSNASVLLKEEHVMQSKGHLIEEIASTEMPEKLNTPVYEMITVKDANKKPLKIELRIELPKVSSVSECDLRISKDDIVIEVPGKYKLQLELPELVDEETTTAVFNKGKRILFITVLVAKPDP
uniref:PIH1 domain-containing protein 2 n=1 Tax=Melopsittacus undulatus TaxID=13146 RepID=A0A8C6JFC2_MELUD